MHFIPLSKFLTAKQTTNLVVTQVFVPMEALLTLSQIEHLSSSPRFGKPFTVL